MTATTRAAYAEFPVTEYRARFERAQRFMADHDLDALLVTGKENVVYFTGLLTVGWISKHRPLGALLPREGDGPILIVPESLAHVAHASSWIERVKFWGGGTWYAGIPKDPIDAIVEATNELKLGQGRLGLELGYGQRLAMPQSDFEALKSALPHANFRDGSALIWRLRMVKSPAEIDALRVACQATTKAFEVTFVAMREGMNEREISALMLREMSVTGYPPGFVMVRSGPDKYQMINVTPFDKPVNRGELVVVDAGAIYKDYWADTMRMASIGEPTDEQWRYFEANRASQQAGVDVIRPGLPGKRVFETAVDALRELGMERQAKIERIGHGVGLDVHEPPSLDGNTDVTLEEGMVLTVEPIITDAEGRGGKCAREDVVVVNRDGHEILSTFPKDLWIA